MAQARWRTEPDHKNPGWPPGIPFIIGNEGCERFGFYGMKSILWIYLVALYGAHGMVEQAAKSEATATVHLFIAGCYTFPMIGAIVSDRLLGKYHTIIGLSVVYVLGQFVLAFFESNLTAAYVGLVLIAIGTGGIKPCVSANVGDQFGRGNWHRVEKIFQAFYFIINFGSAFATLLIPWTRKMWGWQVAFAIPGVLLALATVVFWAGRHRFVHVPPKPGGKLGLLDTLSSVFLLLTLGSLVFTHGLHWALIVLISLGCLVVGLVLFLLRQSWQQDDGFLAVLVYVLRAKLFGAGKDEPSRAEANARQDEPSTETEQAERDRLEAHWFWAPAVRRFGHEAAEGPPAVLRIMTVFFLVLFFWGLFDQHSSTWIQQAKMMDLHFDLPLVGSFDLLASQTPAANPFLVMLLIPFVSFVLYPGIEKLGIKMTPLRRMTAGMLLASAGFATVALIQRNIDAGLATGDQVHVAWQLVPYVLMTLSEVMVSVTGLEFAYTQAPKRMKSTIMGFWLITVALGSILVALVAKGAQLELEGFFWLFTGLMAVAGLLFGLRAAFYRYRDYTQ